MKTKLLPSLSEMMDTLDPFSSTLPRWVFTFHNFLKKEPKLYMFVPCEKILIDNVTDPSNPEYHYELLEKPFAYDNYAIYGKGVDLNTEQFANCKKYQEALDRVIFDGFECWESGDYMHLKNSKITLKMNKTAKVWSDNRGNDITSLADLSGKVYLNENGIKDSGI